MERCDFLIRACVSTTKIPELLLLLLLQQKEEGSNTIVSCFGLFGRLPHNILLLSVVRVGGPHIPRGPPHPHGVAHVLLSMTVYFIWRFGY